MLTLMALCAWPGTPKPQVTWRKGASSEPLRGRPGLAVLDEGSLFLASVSPSDGGDYECQATNEAGSAARRAKLVVYGEQGPQSRGSWHTPARTPGCAGPESSMEGGGLQTAWRLRAEGSRCRWEDGRMYGHPFPRETPLTAGDRAKGRTCNSTNGFKWSSR